MGYKVKDNSLKVAMLKQNTTLSELSKKASITGVSLSRIYNGKPCRAKTANKIAKALNTPVTDLFE